MVGSELQTRKKIIDKLLVDSGWNINDSAQVVDEYFISTNIKGTIYESQSEYKSHQFSDYVLLGRDGTAIAVVEAKKTSKDAELGREQAKQYCYNIQKIKVENPSFGEEQKISDSLTTMWLKKQSNQARKSKENDRGRCLYEHS